MNERAIKKSILKFVDGKSPLSPFHIEETVDLFMRWLSENTLQYTVAQSNSKEILEHHRIDLEDLKRHQDRSCAAKLGQGLLEQCIHKEVRETNFTEETHYSVLAFKAK